MLLAEAEHNFQKLDKTSSKEVEQNFIQKLDKTSTRSWAPEAGQTLHRKHRMVKCI